MSEVELLLDAKATLGEGPSWDASRGILYWVDIPRGHIHEYRPEDGSDRILEVGQPVGAVVFTREGGLIAAMKNGLHRLDPVTGALELIGDPESGLPDNRFNDGKCDTAGRFWAGTMPCSGSEPTGSLYRLDPDGTIHRMLGGIGCSNGIAWNPDDTVMYHIDTSTRRVTAYDYDRETGGLANARTVISLPGEYGLPDGMTSDEEGKLWIAEWGGAAVRRWDPDTGRVLQTIEVPALQVTSCCFGGEHMDELFITSARDGLSERELEERPLSGGLFRVRTGVRGRPTFAYGGSPN